MRRVSRGGVRAGACALVLLLALPAQAAPKRIGAWRDWSAWQAGSGKGKECFAHSLPKQSRGDYTKRGRVSVAVTRRPAAKVANEVSFTAGYRFRPDSEVRVRIDGKTFRLFADGDMAFARDAATDATLVEAMKKGSKLVVEGVSSRGTETTDTYSLSGFTAAHRATTRACPL